MPQVNIVKPFTLRRENGTHETFRPGIQDVSEEDANNLFLQLHTDKPPELDRSSPDSPLYLGPSVEMDIVKPFTLNREDGSSVTYRPGRQQMPKYDAEHGFTQYFTRNPPESIYPPGTREYAEQQVRRQAELEKARMVREQQVHQAAEGVRAQHHAEAHPEGEDENEPETDDDRRENRRRRRGRLTNEERAAREEALARAEADAKAADEAKASEGEHHE